MAEQSNTTARERGDDRGAGNPLLEEWPGPYGGVPPFDRIRVEHFPTALDASVAEALAETEAVASAAEPPTFENTIEALERTARALDRVRSLANVWRTSLSTPEFQKIEGTMMVELAAFSDRVTQNGALFRRIETLWESQEKERLTPEQQRLIWLYYTDFVRSGAALDDAAKSRLAEINQRLAELSTRFDQNVLAAENEDFLVLEDEADLAGLPPTERAAAGAAAEERGMAGKWVIVNTRSAVEPFLTHADRRELREQVWWKFVSRGDVAGERDNKPVISEILALRVERARLLGYPSHAHWAIERSMAKTPERALELMEAVWKSATEQVRKEVAAMREHVAETTGERSGEITIEPWDYRYYADRVRKRQADLDWDEVKPYLQLERFRDGMFWVAGELFDLEFRLVDLPVYHAGVRAWEVRDRTSDRPIGLFYFDPFARRGKRSGAWMNNYRMQRKLGEETISIVSNNANYLKGSPDEPVLISWSDARTLFHEFGHALHGLLSNVTYPSLGGTAVPTDYVEFPSQLLEHWLTTPEFLRRFALHYQTGEPMPSELIGRVELAEKLGRGFSTTEELASGLVDMKIHLAADPDVDPIEFERTTLAELGLPREMVMRHRLPHFSHIFSGDHYAAKYYSYLWADVLSADTAEAFRERGSMYDRSFAERLRDRVLSRGNSIDPEEGFRELRGREPRIDALLRKRGFAA